jgi:hypothetical protein
VVDHGLVRVAALDESDPRAFNVRVAGVAALLVSKLHKIAERADTRDRRKDKDGLDVLRLLRFTMPVVDPLDGLQETPAPGR